MTEHKQNWPAQYGANPDEYLGVSDPWEGYWAFKCPVCKGHDVPAAMGPCGCTDSVICIDKEPKAGMLVKWTDEAKQWLRGKWNVLEWECVSSKPIDIAPLLPAPAQLQAHGLTAWDAVGLIGSIIPGGLDSYHIKFGKFCYGRFYRDGRRAYNVSHTLWGDEHQELPSSYQKYTTLRQYLEQFKEAK